MGQKKATVDDSELLEMERELRAIAVPGKPLPDKAFSLYDTILLRAQPTLVGAGVIGRTLLMEMSGLRDGLNDIEAAAFVKMVKVITTTPN